MTTGLTTHDAMQRWAMALDAAPRIIEGQRYGAPEEAQRMADSSAALHGLLCWLRRSCPDAEPDAARLDWNIALLEDAATVLYRELGLPDPAIRERIGRLSGAMMGTARQMNGSALTAWDSLCGAEAAREPLPA